MALCVPNGWRKWHGDNEMTMANGFVLLLSGIIWLVCILLGVGIGVLAGRPVGMLLGWMVANSLDESLAKGGRIGQQFGNFLESRLALVWASTQQYI